jgi:putative Mn2+ efflux pump MntP
MAFVALHKERRGKFMGFMGIMLLAVGLSMDSSAISACKGLAMPKVNYRHVAIIALSFGGAEGILALLGWLLGRQFYNTIVHFDHWIVLILLAFVGGKMIWDAFHEDLEAEERGRSFSIRETIFLAVVTSIDALAAGVSFAFIRMSIPTAIAAIAITSATLSFISVMIGHFFSARFGKAAEIAGGAMLILIGIYLFSH